MSDLDSLTLNAVAVPHDDTRRLVLADRADENNDHAVGKALRDDVRGPAVLRATWLLAQERRVEPEYRLLWAVIMIEPVAAAAKRQPPTDPVPDVAPPTPAAPLPVASRPERRPGFVRPPDRPWRLSPGGDWTYRGPDPNVALIEAQPGARAVADELREAARFLHSEMRDVVGGLGVGGSLTADEFF